MFVCACLAFWLYVVYFQLEALSDLCTLITAVVRWSLHAKKCTCQLYQMIMVNHVINEHCYNNMHNCCTQIAEGGPAM